MCVPDAINVVWQIVGDVALDAAWIQARLTGRIPPNHWLTALKHAAERTLHAPATAGEANVAKPGCSPAVSSVVAEPAANKPSVANAVTTTGSATPSAVEAVQPKPAQTPRVKVTDSTGLPHAGIAKSQAAHRSQARAGGASPPFTRGVVTRWMGSRRFGFIRCEEHESLFVHARQLQMASNAPPFLQTGQQVEFTIGASRGGGWEAYVVTGVDRKPLPPNSRGIPQNVWPPAQPAHSFGHEIAMVHNMSSVSGGLPGYLPVHVSQSAAAYGGMQHVYPAHVGQGSTHPPSAPHTFVSPPSGAQQPHDRRPSGHQTSQDADSVSSSGRRSRDRRGDSGSIVSLHPTDTDETDVAYRYRPRGGTNSTVDIAYHGRGTGTPLRHDHGQRRLDPDAATDAYWRAKRLHDQMLEDQTNGKGRDETDHSSLLADVTGDGSITNSSGLAAPGVAHGAIQSSRRMDARQRSGTDYTAQTADMTSWESQTVLSMRSLPANLADGRRPPTSGHRSDLWRQSGRNDNLVGLMEPANHAVRARLDSWESSSSSHAVTTSSPETRGAREPPINGPAAFGLAHRMPATPAGTADGQLPMRPPPGFDAVVGSTVSADGRSPSSRKPRGNIRRVDFSDMASGSNGASACWF